MEGQIRHGNNGGKNKEETLVNVKRQEGYTNKFKNRAKEEHNNFNYLELALKFIP